MTRARVRRLAPSDRAEWLRMRAALWPDADEADADAWAARGDAAATLVAERDGGGGKRLAGFVEVGERSFADGCLTSPVAYVEGWWVDPDARGGGVGAALMRGAEDWARSRGRSEIASDAEIGNAGSRQAHAALGFEEVGEAVSFRKDLGGARPAARRGVVKAKAMGVSWHGDRVLVERGLDRATGERFYRAIGGSIEFGERSADALRREWREEYGIEISGERLLGVIENLFEHEGERGHEIVFVFEATLADAPALAARGGASGVDPEGVRHEAVFVPLADLARGATPFRPEAALRLLLGR